MQFLYFSRCDAEGPAEVACKPLHMACSRGAQGFFRKRRGGRDHLGKIGAPAKVAGYETHHDRLTQPAQAGLERVLVAEVGAGKARAHLVGRKRRIRCSFGGERRICR